MHIGTQTILSVQEALAAVYLLTPQEENELKAVLEGLEGLEYMLASSAWLIKTLGAKRILEAVERGIGKDVVDRVILAAHEGRAQ